MADTNPELLGLAAKAAGITHSRYPATEHGVYHDGGKWWNPLTDDGDALRLAVKLRIDFQVFPLNAHMGPAMVRAVVDRLGKSFGVEVENGDELAATRRAIVRAAAEIGRTA